MQSRRYFKRCISPSCDNPLCDNSWQEINRPEYIQMLVDPEEYDDFQVAIVTVPLLPLQFPLPLQKKARVRLEGAWINIYHYQRRLASFYYRPGGQWKIKLEKWIEEHPEYRVSRKILDKFD